MKLEISCSTRTGSGESDCRERCGWWVTPGRIVMALAEGVGHGAEAAYAAEVALACIGAGLERSVGQHFAVCDARLRGTVGVALAIAIVDQESGRTTLASVGNVRAVLLAEPRNSHAGAVRGIIGITYDTLKPETTTLVPDDLLALSSCALDGFLETGRIRELCNPISRDLARDVLDRWTPSYDDAALVIYRHQHPCLSQVSAETRC